jgi:hypothetical protein
MKYDTRYDVEYWQKTARTKSPYDRYHLANIEIDEFGNANLSLQLVCTHWDSMLISLEKHRKEILRMITVDSVISN